MNTSRTPVFEALKQLETIGFVEHKQGQNGWYVSRLNKENAIELCIARATIEQEAAFLCAQQSVCAHLAEMEALAEKYKSLMITGGNCELTETVDTSFHKLIVEACGNKYLLHSYEDIAKGLVRYQFHAKRSIMADSSNKLRQTVATQHISIVNSIKLCMPEFARHEMENHMNACTAIILNSIDDM
jgi:DNA-binding GntR family transcriptional regulator